MTKSKTILAGLGVVAALGVAALPLTSFASESVSGNVDVIVEVQPAIAMAITGDNDSADGYGAAQAKAPNAATMIAGFDASSFSNGIAAATSSSKTELLPASSVHGTASDFRSVITVYTNNTSGYTLGISGIGALTKEAGVTIPATGVVKAGTAGWGYAVDTAVTASSESTAATGSENYAFEDDSDILTAGKGAAATSASGEVTTVYYGVSTSDAQATGTYTDTITYTATTK